MDWTAPFKALAEWLGWGREREARLNTPEMIQRDQAKKDQKAKDSADEVIAKGDVDETRNRLD